MLSLQWLHCSQELFFLLRPIAEFVLQGTVESWAEVKVVLSDAVER